MNKQILNEQTANEAEAFRKLYDIVVRLRSPGGCPWDREQTPLSLRGDLIEETYECVEAIDEEDPSHVQEELGDIFLLAVMIAYMHEQDGHFTVKDVLEDIAAKLVRRHPHVFGEAGARDGRRLSSAEVLSNWAQIKVEQEGRKPKDSILDEVSRGLPPLDRAWKLQKKAAKAGFDWPDIRGVSAKIEEELREVLSAAGSRTQEAPSSPAALEEELGDLLFSAVNLCRYLGVEPSVALQRTNLKFTRRFKYVEKRMKETGQVMTPQNLSVMDQYWNEAKKN
ncbi:MAG: nucleoside triphosphate pyrophosphohydrolase [Treponema sp.]|nr:nucleoside triphosphate pyrophosphohydrolase [Treponema sp.]